MPKFAKKAKEVEKKVAKKVKTAKKKIAKTAKAVKMNSNEVEILLIEDNPNDAELAIRALKQYNLVDKLVWIKDGEEALDFIFAQGQYSDRSIEDIPKVILLDLKLPKVDGLKVLKEIRSDKRTRTIPVVVLTSSSEEQDIITSYNLDVNGYILKSVGFDRFVDAVKEISLYFSGRIKSINL
jgi:CheY-like chemotaxis protein